jgi:hypothetical protein
MGKVTTPVALELPEAVPIVVEAEVEDRLTALPLTGFPLASFKVTVIVAVCVPSATIMPALETTVDVEGETAPAV